MPTGTTTRIEMAACAAPVDPSDGGRKRRRAPRRDPLRGGRRGDAARGLGASGLLRARALPSRDGVARVALVQTAASLLSGDHVTLTVDCGPGCRLELVEVAGMVAHDVRGGPGARLDVRVALGAGARMSWAARPLTLAAGCDLRRSTRVDLRRRCRAALARHARPRPRRRGTRPHARRPRRAPRRGRAARRAARHGRPRALVLTGRPRRRRAGPRHARALRRPCGAEQGTLQLAGPGTIRPLPAPSLATAARTLDPLQARWRAAPLLRRPPRTRNDR